MALKDVKGMNIAQVIEYYGNHPVSRDRTFFMYYDEEGRFQEVSFGRFLEMSMDYARMIDSLRRRRGRGGDGRFHVGFYMQNTPEVLYAFGGCAFTNATLVGINNAQVGQRLAADIRNMDVDMLLVDEVQQPKSERTFLESVMEAHRDHDLSCLYPEYVIARKRQQRNHPARVATIGEMLEEAAGENFSPTPLEPERAGVIIFTSGTTGMPKGIEVPWKKLFDVGVMSTTILNYGEDPPRFDVSGFYGFCSRKVPSYALPGYIRVLGELPKTDTQKVRKPVLLHEFIERTPVTDGNENDLIYSVKGGVLEEFTTPEYRYEMDRCTDPMVRSRFAAVTRRHDLFKE